MILDSFIIMNAIAMGLTLSTKFVYRRINDNHDIFFKILNEGLYHITSLENAEKIMKSGEIRASSLLTSYGFRKSFFFAGVPDVNKIFVNLELQNVNYDMYAVKVNLNYNQVAQFKERVLNDNAVTYQGNCKLEDKQASIVKLVLDFDKNKQLICREIGLHESYTPSAELQSHFLNLKGFYGKCKQIAKSLKFDITTTSKNMYHLLRQNRYKLSNEVIREVKINELKQLRSKLDKFTNQEQKDYTSHEMT